MTATTALTAQNTTGVADIHHIPPEFVRKQIDAVFSDIHPGVVKTGESDSHVFHLSLFISRLTNMLFRNASFCTHHRDGRTGTEGLQG